MPTPRPHPEVIVVGAGVMGAAAAWQLAKDGRRVLLLEQHALGHAHGSSHGGSRIARIVHPERDHVAAMPATFALWRELEAETGESVLTLTGGLYTGPPGDPFFTSAIPALDEHGLPYRLLEPFEVARQHPQLRVPPTWMALEQRDSGILAASRAVRALVAAGERRGVVLREQVRMVGAHPHPDGGVELRLTGPTGRETIRAERLVITAGPWAPRLLRPLLRGALPRPLPLTVTHQQVAYFPVARPELWSQPKAPVWLFTSEPHLYGFPIHERPGEVKVALELVGGFVDPDASRSVDEGALERLRDLVAAHLVGVAPEPSQVELCLYTESPGRDFIVDRHPEHPQILFATGFSGRGFKHAVAIGRLLADLVAGEPGSYHSAFWSPRFRLPRG